MHHGRLEMNDLTLTTMTHEERLFFPKRSGDPASLWTSWIFGRVQAAGEAWADLIRRGATQ
jgi:hypothetical protein